jgi:hypothetical protein
LRQNGILDLNAYYGTNSKPATEEGRIPLPPAKIEELLAPGLFPDASAYEA